MKNTIKIIFTDLDGTLLSSSKEISNANRDCLEQLGRHNVIRVISTGRSLFSYRRLLGDTVPVDYLVFSNGAGVLDLKSDSLLYSRSLGEEDIQFISSHLTKNGADFMVHHTVPDNHYFTYYRNQKSNPDFMRRIKIYQNYAQEHTSNESPIIRSAQIIAVFPHDIVRFNKVKEGLNGYQVTRTTSPLDGRSIWMEIYPQAVSKGESAKWLCSHLQIDRRCSFGIGNDYNDISLLDYTRFSYVVANSPAEMQRSYTPTASHDDDGFYHAVNSAVHA